MKACPHCGYYNLSTAVYCRRCHQEPVPLPPPAFWTPLRLYLLGIGLGLVPLTLWLAAWSFDASVEERWAAVWLYVIQLVAGLVCLFSRRARHVGYGLLTMDLVDPVVGVIGCIAIMCARYGSSCGMAF
jgi:hypothetical protein